MSKKTTEESFVKFRSADVLHASESLIAVSSILVACADQYALSGHLQVGALLHAGNVVDQVIDRLELAELAVEQPLLPF